MDDSTPGNNKHSTGEDLRFAIDLMLQGKKLDFEQHLSMGCSIKWK